MLFPEEIFVKDFLPNIRVILAKEFYKRNYSQTQIAEILGITQARVNGYLKSNYNEAIKNLEKIGIKSEDVELLINNSLAEVPIDKFYILRTIHSFWQNILSSGKVCNYHYKISGLSSNCTICLKPELATDFMEELRMKNELKEAFKTFSSSPLALKIVPQINTNIAYSKKRAEKTQDIMAFPGRIVKFMDTLRILGEPEFGASTHLAKMLLQAHLKNNEIRACLYIKFDKLILRSIKELNINYDFNELKDNKEDPVVFSFKEFLKRNQVPTVLIDEGRKNYEAVCYIFGKSPIDVVKLALIIAEKYTLLS